MQKKIQILPMAPQCTDKSPIRANTSSTSTHGTMIQRVDVHSFHFSNRIRAGPATYTDDERKFLENYLLIGRLPTVCGFMWCTIHRRTIAWRKLHKLFGVYFRWSLSSDS